MAIKLTKRISSIVLVLAMVVLSINFAVFAADSTALQGTGTQSDPYLVSQADQLTQLEGKTDAYVKLTADIDLSQTTSPGKVDGWADYYINQFSGTIDGDGHRIFGAGANSVLIANFGGGELKNLTFELNGSPAALVWYGYTANAVYNYTDVNITGNVTYTSSNNNEQPLVIYAGGNTTLTRVHVSADIQSPTYNSIFIGYTPFANSSYTLVDCTYSGNAVMAYPGIIFANATSSANLLGTSTLTVSGCEITGTVLGTTAEPKYVGSVSYKTDFDAKEAEAAAGFNVTGTVAKAAELTNYSYTLNDNGNLKISIANGAADVASFKVVSEVFYNAYYADGTSWGTLKASVSEDIPVQNGAVDYYSSLGKVEFYDGADGTAFTTGVNGQLQAVDVNGKTGYVLATENKDPSLIYKLGAFDTENNWKTSTVTVFAYDQNGQLLNTISGGTSEAFDLTIEPVQSQEGTALSAVQAPAGATWVNPDAVLVAGEQICFALKGTEVVPVKVKATSKPVVQVPVIDSSVPVTEVQVGAAADTEAILHEVIAGNTDAVISPELQQTINDAVANGDQVTVTLKTEKVADTLVPAADTESINAFLAAQTGTSGQVLAVQQYFDFSIVVLVNNQQVGEITDLNNSPVTLQIAIPAELQIAGRTFGVVRVHNGVAELLNSTVADGIITFETNRFSTYALVSFDAANAQTGGTAGTQGTITDNTANTAAGSVTGPQTGDTTQIAVWAAVAGVCAAAMVVLFVLKKKANN